MRTTSLYNHYNFGRNTLIVLFFSLLSNISFGQNWTHDFETAGGYAASDAECTDGTFDYFIRTDGSNITDTPTGEQGSFYFAAQDIDAATCPAITGGNGSLLFDDININGCTGLSFQALVAHVSVFSGWDNDEFLHIDYDIDNSGIWTNLLWFENNGGGTNQIAQQDTDFDGIGDGTVLGSVFQNFTGAIAGTGSIIDIRVTFKLSDGGADALIDNLRIFGTGCTGATSITTGILSGGGFLADCGNNTGTNGSVAFTSIGTYLVGNVFTVELSDASGSFASPIIIGSLSGALAEGLDPASSISFNIPGTTVTGVGYLIRITSSTPSVTGSNSASFVITQVNTCAITTGAITGAPFMVNCTTSTNDIGSIVFTSTGTMSVGNIYSVELSDETGSFGSPTIIGSLSSTINSGSIPITIPVEAVTGSGYLIRIVSSSPAMTGSNSAVITITQMAPCLPTIPSSSGLIINEFSNGSVGNEEYYEFVVAGECGNLVDIRNFILDDNNGTFTTPSFYSGSASGIAPGHFRFSNDAQWAAIPVGSLIVVYNANERNSAIPADDPTDANGDSLYIVPHDDALFERCTTMPSSASPDSIYTPCTYATAPLTGWGPLSLRNGGDAIQVRFPSGDYYHGISYGGNEISGGPDDTKLFTVDGADMAGWFNSGDFFDVANWSSGAASAGNQTPGAANNAANLAWLRAMRNVLGTTCPITVLPIELSIFKGDNIPAGNQLYWKTESEINSSHFSISRSEDGQNWRPIHIENAVGNSTNYTNYTFIDTDFDRVLNYYRLTQVDINGVETIFNRYVAIDNTKLKNPKLIRVVNVLGQEINVNQSGIQIHVYEDGSIQKIYHY